MEKFIAGDVVVLPFPFTDLSSAKKRPALILADLVGDDYIMLQITSKNVRDNYAISLLITDFSSGSLHQNGNIRPNKIFTLDKKLILYKIGHLNDDKLSECINAISDIVSQDKQKQLEYEARQKAILDYNQMMFEAEERGREQGIEQGIELANYNSAKNLIALGLSTDIIAQGTGLSAEDIDKLRKEEQNHV